LGDGLTIAYMAGAAKVTEQLAAMTQERDRNWSNATANAMRLVYAQAHIKELREALERIAKYPRVRGDELGYEGCRQVASKALAIPDDQSALDAALKVEREKICNVMELQLSERQRRIFRSMK